MITVILTYRNREIRIVKNCLDSLKQQSNSAFKVLLINYGSNTDFSNAINQLVIKYEFANIINCKTNGQLWCKARAINIGLNHCNTPFIFVGDVDMIFHPKFIERLINFNQVQTTTYFQVGFLSKIESTCNKDFDRYAIKFKSNQDATGMAFFSRKDLMDINGYDEFYHGWGSEDTDILIRLNNAGKKVRFYDDEVLLLHQWHPKLYRSKTSFEPFHSHLEKINHSYLEYTKQSNKKRANLDFGFGLYEQSGYELLNYPEIQFQCTNRKDQIKGFINNILMNKRNKVVKLTIGLDSEYKSIKQFLKKVLGIKTISFFSLQQTNDLILEIIISQLRNCPYNYAFDKEKKIIELTIKL
jgi:predicted glycosyltransferase involved in capsule biosynthesis